MYISQSASSTPTPRSTSRVMMTGLIGLDLRREDWSGPSHDDRRKTCLMESCRWNPAEKLGIAHGRSGKDGYHIYRVPPTILWSFPAPHAVPRGGGYTVWHPMTLSVAKEKRPLVALLGLMVASL